MKTLAVKSKETTFYYFSAYTDVHMAATKSQVIRNSEALNQHQELSKGQAQHCAKISDQAPIWHLGHDSTHPKVFPQVYIRDEVAPFSTSVPVSHRGQQTHCSCFGQRQRDPLVDARSPSVNLEGGPRQVTTIACYQPLPAFTFIRTEEVLKTRFNSFQKCCYCYEILNINYCIYGLFLE